MPKELIRWVVFDIDAMEVADNASIEIKFDGATSPVEPEDSTTKCQGTSNNGRVKCKIKESADDGDYKYTVILSGGKLDPHVYVNKVLIDD